MYVQASRISKGQATRCVALDYVCGADYFSAAVVKNFCVASVRALLCFKAHERHAWFGVCYVLVLSSGSRVTPCAPAVQTRQLVLPSRTVVAGAKRQVRSRAAAWVWVPSFHARDHTAERSVHDVALLGTLAAARSEELSQMIPDLSSQRKFAEKVCAAPAKRAT